MAKQTVELVRFHPRDATDIILSGQLHLPPRMTVSTRVAIIGHPDPRMGGTMDYPLVVAIGEVLAQKGIAALRFNYRGVGQSGGKVAGDGQTELDDIAGALDMMLERFETDVCYIAGYSYGALMALRAAESEPAVVAAAMVALPQPYVSRDERGRRPLPRLLVIPEEDQYSTPAWGLEFAARCTPAAGTWLVAGADHFLQGKEEEIAQTIARFFVGSDGLS